MRDNRRNVRLSLASLDFLGSDAELRAGAERAMREAEAGPGPDGYTGRDRTGTVTVHAGAPEGTVDSVTVRQDWRARLGAGGFPDALFEAYTAVVRATLEAAALRALREEHEPRPAPRAPDAPDSREADEHLWLRRTWETLHRIDADLARLSQTASPEAEGRIVSPNGSLTLHLRGGTIAAVTGDAGLLARSDAGQLQYEALTVLRTYELAHHPRKAQA